MNEADVKQKIILLEQARCRALVEADIDSLETLVSDDVVHVHANGKAANKTAYLLMVESRSVSCKQVGRRSTSASTASLQSPQDICIRPSR
jgi:hypothetical protein